MYSKSKNYYLWCGRYFAAGKDRGVFVTANKVTKLEVDAPEQQEEEEEDGGYEESCEASLCESTTSFSPAPARSSSATPAKSGSNRVRRSLSLRHTESRGPPPSLTTSLPRKHMQCCHRDPKTTDRYRQQISLPKTHKETNSKAELCQRV